jgi:hypothetical protein
MLETQPETDMFGYSRERTVVFFVARSHTDLSWYLSFNALSPAANDAFLNRGEARACHKRGLVLRLVISQSD